MRQHVLITGGSRGLGLALVEGCLDWGYCVSTCSRSKTPYIEHLEVRYQARFSWAAADLALPGSAASFVRTAVEKMPRANPFGLVNNAGIVGEGIHSTFPMSDVRHILDVNLVASLEAAREFLRILHLTRKPGRIVNITSIIGVRGYTGLAAYSASKAGMDGLTKALSREWGRTGTTVNAIAPGYLETELSTRLDQDQLDQIIRRTPLNRLGSVDDVVPVLRFLLSEESRFITGQTLIVDGGITV